MCFGLLTPTEPQLNLQKFASIVDFPFLAFSIDFVVAFHFDPDNTQFI